MESKGIFHLHSQTLTLLQATRSDAVCYEDSICCMGDDWIEKHRDSMILYMSMEHFSVCFDRHSIDRTVAKCLVALQSHALYFKNSGAFPSLVPRKSACQSSSVSHKDSLPSFAFRIASSEI